MGGGRGDGFWLRTFALFPYMYLPVTITRFRVQTVYQPMVQNNTNFHIWPRPYVLLQVCAVQYCSRVHLPKTSNLYRERTGRRNIKRSEKNTISSS
jgi:hypothetical protein